MREQGQGSIQIEMAHKIAHEAVLAGIIKGTSNVSYGDAKIRQALKRICFAQYSKPCKDEFSKLGTKGIHQFANITHK